VLEYREPGDMMKRASPTFTVLREHIPDGQPVATVELIFVVLKQDEHLEGLDMMEYLGEWPGRGHLFMASRPHRPGETPAVMAVMA